MNKLFAPACCLLVLTIVWGCAPQRGAQAMALDAPDRVALGDAFLATAWCQTPAAKGDKAATFRWRGRTYSVPLMPTQASGYGGVAYMLLPVPVDHQGLAPMELEVRCPNAKTSVARRTLALYAKDRPVQELTVAKKYVHPPKSVQERIAEDRRKVRAATGVFSPQPLWHLPLARPVPGSVSSQFGLKRVFNGEPRSVHKGLDLRGPEGTPVRALADGLVVLVDNLYFSGNVVYIDHGVGVVSASLHLSKALVRKGQRVRRGETIGLVGATGRVTGPHLHLSLIVQGVSVDPLPLLEARQDATGGGQ